MVSGNRLESRVPLKHNVGPNPNRFHAKIHALYSPWIFFICVATLCLSGSLGHAQTIYVTTSKDVNDIPNNATIDDLPGPDGVVSFREALLASDNTAGRQTIGFQIPKSDWYLPDLYPGLVLLQGSLRWSAFDPVTIDGTTQTAFTGDTNPDGNEMVLYGLGLTFNGDGSELLGFYGSEVTFNCHNGLAHNNDGKMYLIVSTGSGNIFRNNDAGTIKIAYSSHNTVVSNVCERIRISGAGRWNPAVGNRIGGPDIADRNYITGWGNYGQHGYPAGTTVELYGTLDTLIENNYIGTTPDGMEIGNQASTAGIGIFSENDNLTIQNNLIATHAVHASGGGHFGAPIFIDAYEGGDHIHIFGNTLGLNALGDPVLGGLHGIWINPLTVEYATNLRIGGTQPGQENIIAGHHSTGILLMNGPGIPPADGIRISGNSIYGNGDIAIDLMPNTWDFGRTPNDPLDADAGANGLQNFPQIAKATQMGRSIRVIGQLQSEINSEYTVEFFASSSGDPNQQGQGEMYIGSTTVFTDINGDASIDATLGKSVPADWVITATATHEPSGATSEFSDFQPIQSFKLQYQSTGLRKSP